jgi:hypothetical protein
MNKHIVIAILCVLVLAGCAAGFLDKISSKYEFLLRIADLAKATINEDHEIDWVALEQIGKTWGVDVKTPTEAFVQAASELKVAYKAIYAAIGNSRTLTDTEERQALNHVLRKMDWED